MKKALLTIGFISLIGGLNSGATLIPYHYNKLIKLSPTEIAITVIGTVYNPESAQTDANPYELADGTNIKYKNINKLRYVALSRDLIKDEYRANLFKTKKQWHGKIQFGDTIYVTSENKLIEGYWIVKDCMNSRFSKRIDFLQDKKTGFYGKWDNIKIKLKEV